MEYSQKVFMLYSNYKIIYYIEILFGKAFSVLGYYNILAPKEYEVEELGYFEVATGLRIDSEIEYDIEESYDLLKNGIIIDTMYNSRNTGELVLCLINEYEWPSTIQVFDSVCAIIPKQQPIVSFINFGNNIM
jgi:hypothetical protein